MKLDTYMSRIRNNKGLTLLEVMIAMVIMSVSLLGLLQMAMIALDGNHWSNLTTRTVQLMQQKLEEIRSSQDFTSGSETVDEVELTWTVSTAGVHLRQVDIEARWRDISQNQRANSMTAFIKSDSV